MVQYNTTGSYAGMQIHLKRNSLGLLLGGYFIPMLLFTLISLLSYGIDPKAVPGRLGLLVTVDLISMNCYNSVEGPLSRGFSYIELWMVGKQNLDF